MFQNISFQSKLQTVGSQKQDFRNSVSLEIIHNSLLPENVYYIFAKKIRSKYSLHQQNQLQYLLRGLSLHLNHLIAWHTGISFWQFGTLPIGIILSNLDSRHLMTSPRTLLGQF